jgi:glycolate oxidase iron-sulfur subunit
VQTPCSLQHGQRLGGRIEPLLRDLGWDVLSTDEGHLCCGSAGSYSVLQPAMAGDLRVRKLGKLMHSHPQEIVTANIGCQLHLSASATVPVHHWLEVLAAALN